ncbi:chemotaxis protein CheW [Desulfallas thermosapovorans]|uniref:Purine-binding chemotaxis protein CheW n=1 Tax=Desulfallas thermosapovorans DSM 6562 TaxID=1121431 RepID=A0A5S4ZRV1_9FIRM|nr:chemotaxis protein CheW [Desulfallas thermosapovorans]TYO95535.1 purine-binding chemotaxis protein CheW [Desulfallas thermosapovorans DSM 6562]
MNAETSFATDLQIVVFSIAGQSFGIDIASVFEIIRLEKITPIPQAPEYVEGVINIRGQVVPALNLHVLFGTGIGEKTGNSRMIVVETAHNKFGLIVDAVYEVQKVSPDMIKPAPAAIAYSQQYIQGIILEGDNLVILVDLNKLLPERDLLELKEMEKLA